MNKKNRVLEEFEVIYDWSGGYKRRREMDDGRHFECSAEH